MYIMKKPEFLLPIFGYVVRSVDAVEHSDKYYCETPPPAQPAVRWRTRCASCDGHTLSQKWWAASRTLMMPGDFPLC